MVKGLGALNKLMVAVIQQVAMECLLRGHAMSNG